MNIQSTSQSNIRILFVRNLEMRFAMVDKELLEKKYALTDLYIRSPKTSPLPIYRAVKQHDIVFGWFASWHTLLPVLFARKQRKPSLLIVGGYDTAANANSGYEDESSKLKKALYRLTMRKATRLAAFSNASREDAIKYGGVQPERISTIYLGVEDTFKELPKAPRRKMALTVGNIKRENLIRKGIEPFVRSATFVPEVEFVVVGNPMDDAINYLKQIAGSNVTFTGKVDDPTLINYYKQASVYGQPSSHEGFGLSVAEAMLGGCIPVVTKVGSLPEVVGETGIFTESAEPEHIAAAIRKGLELPESARVKARQHVLDCYPMEKRANLLSKEIECLVGRGGK